MKRRALLERLLKIAIDERDGRFLGDNDDTAAAVVTAVMRMPRASKRLREAGRDLGSALEEMVSVLKAEIEREGGGGA